MFRRPVLVRSKTIRFHILAPSCRSWGKFNYGRVRMSPALLVTRSHFAIS
jgi:hypothetical protein